MYIYIYIYIYQMITYIYNISDDNLVTSIKILLKKSSDFNKYKF